MKTSLATKMIDRANQDSLPEDHEVRRVAIEFDDFADKYFNNPKTTNSKRFLGLWARARRIWCNYSGESLI